MHSVSTPTDLKRALLLAVILLFAASTVTAQVPLPSAVAMWASVQLSQSVTVSVDAINKVSVSGTVTLTIGNATPGSAPDADTEATTNYAVTVNGSNKKLTGSLDASFATGITLEVLLTAPTGATASQKTLGTISQDLVTGIGHIAESSLTITYTASATVAAVPNGGGVSRTLTFTLTDI